MNKISVISQAVPVPKFKVLPGDDCVLFNGIKAKCVSVMFGIKSAPEYQIQYWDAHDVRRVEWVLDHELK